MINIADNRLLEPLKRELSSDDFAFAVKIITTLRPTVDLTCLHLMIKRLEECCLVAQWIEWPEPIAAELTQCLQLCKKVMSCDFYIAQSGVVKTDRNPIGRRFKEFPVAALYCQEFAGLHEEGNKNLLLMLHYFLYQILWANSEGDIDVSDELIAAASSEIRLLTAGKKPLRASIIAKSNPINLNAIKDYLLSLVERSIVDLQQQFLSAWQKITHNMGEVAQITVYQDPGLVKTSHRGENSQQFFSGTSISKPQIYINVKNDNLESDEYVNELVTLPVDDNLTIDHRTKNQTINHGNQFILWQKLNLPWSTNILAPHEVEALADYISQKISSNEMVKPAILTLALLLTSKPYEYVTNIKIYTNTSNGGELTERIDLELACWIRRSIVMEASYKPKETDKPFLRPHNELVALPLPDVFIKGLVSLIKEAGCNSATLGQLCAVNNNFESIVSDFTKSLRLNNRIHRRITPSAIRHTLYSRLCNKFDDGYASLILANTEYDIPTSHYYLSASVAKIGRDYADNIYELGFETVSVDANEDVVTGSKLSILQEGFANFIEKLTVELQEKVRVKISIEDVEKVHNLFVYYLSLMFLAATGHRKRTEFGLVNYSIDYESNLIMISDKVNHLDSSVRILPLPTLLKKQIESYRYHCLKISHILLDSAPNLSNQLIRIGQCMDSEPILLLIKGKRGEVLSNVDLTNFLSNWSSLPLNFLRHYFASKVREQGEYKLAKSMMGHVSDGENVLSDYSLMSMNDIGNIANVIDDILFSLNFTHVCVNKKTPKKISLPKQVFDETYCPDYLKRVESKGAGEIIKWARQLVERYKAEASLYLEEKSQREFYINKGLDDTDFLVPRQKKIYFLNRFLDKVISEKSWISAVNVGSTLSISTSILHSIKQRDAVVDFFHEWINRPDESGNEIIDCCCKFLLSAAIHSPFKVSVQTLLDGINQKVSWITEQPWLTIENKDVVLDSISSLLFFKLKKMKVKLIIQKKCVMNHFKRLMLNNFRRHHCPGDYLYSVFSSVDKLFNFLSETRATHMSSLSTAYLAGKIDTTDLTAIRKDRWLSNGEKSIVGEEMLDDMTLPSFNVFCLEQENDAFQNTLLLIKALHKELTKQIAASTKNSSMRIESIITDVWAEQIGCSGEKNVHMLLEQSKSICISFILVLLWLLDVAKHPGRKRRAIAASTIKTYLSNIAKPLLEQTYSLNILELDSDCLYEIYTAALDARNIEHRGERAKTLRSFHQYISTIFEIATVDWYEVEPSICGKGKQANANLISFREYSIALSLLANDVDNSDYVKNLNQLMLIICYRAGLRSGETFHLNTDDIDTVNWIVHVRSSSNHRLKTEASNRRVPIGLVLSEAEKELISSHILMLSSHFKGATSVALFCDLTNLQCYTPKYKVILRVSIALKVACGDNGIRLHHARHSFANYMLLLMYQNQLPPIVTREIAQWSGVGEKYLQEYSAILINCLVGNEREKHKILHALSKLLGHSKPLTTLKSYIHTLEIIAGSECEIYISEQYQVAEICKLSPVERTLVYKVIARGKDCIGYHSLMKFLSKNNHDVFVRKVESVTDKKLVLPKQVYVPDSSSLCLHFIERVIRAKEQGLSNTTISNTLHADYDFVCNVVDEAIKIKMLVGYSGVQLTTEHDGIFFDDCKLSAERSAKYVNHEKFISLLDSINKLSSRDKEKLINFWVESYHNNLGLFVLSKSLEDVGFVCKSLGAYLVVRDENVKVSTKFGGKIGNRVQFCICLGERKVRATKIFNHCMFLLKVLTNVNLEGCVYGY